MTTPRGDPEPPVFKNFAQFNVQSRSIGHDMIVDDSLNYHAYWNTNFHAQSSTIIDHHVVWTSSNTFSEVMTRKIC